MCEHVNAGTHGGLCSYRRLWATLFELGTKLRSSARVVCFLRRSTISPARDFLRRTLSPTVLNFREYMNMPRNYNHRKNPCVFWLRLLEYYSILKILDLLVSLISRTIIFHVCTAIKWDLKIIPLSRTQGNTLNVYPFVCFSVYLNSELQMSEQSLNITCRN